MNTLRSNPDKHRPNLLGLSLAAAAVLMLVGVLTLNTLGSRNNELDNGIRQIEQHDRILAEHVARSFDSIEVLLDEMRVAIQEGGWQRWSSAQGHQYIKMRLSRSLPQIRHLLLFDAEGIQRHTSFSENPPPISVRDRLYFKQLLEGADRARSGPFIGRNSNRPTYSLARRLSSSGGQFTGVLMVAVEPAYFEEFCRATRPHDQFEAAIVNAEGAIIAICRSLDAISGKPLGGAGDDFRKVLAAGEFSELSLSMNRSSVENEAFIMATEPVPGYPDLRVVSATPKSVLLRGWRKHVQQILLLTVLALTTLGMAVVLIRRQFKQLSRLTSELKSNKELLEERIAEATEELNLKRNEAERMAEAKSRFFAAASHDLRQPLHALQLFLGDLARLSESPEQRLLVQRIESATHAMTGQLRSMLDISRLDMANIVPQRATLQLIDIFDQLAATYSPAAEAARVRLLFRPRSATLETDAALLIRLLGNLVDNAIKFSPGGTVLVCARWRANAVRIEIRDNGKGIPPAHQKAIYDEFFQVGNDARNPGAGLGLGLSIAHRIARLLGANISLRSAAARGTTFALTLPCVVGHRPQPSTAPARATRLILIGPPGDFAERARRWGYVVELAENAASAKRLMLDGHAIPLVIHDGSAGLPSDLQSLLLQHPGVVITPAECDIPELGTYHLYEPVKPARLRALLRSLHLVPGTENAEEAMKNEHAPETPATRFLRTHNIAHSNHLYDYEEHGGTKVSARELNVDEHAVVKTLVMEDENAKPLIVLMHGDRKVSTKELARQIGCKKVEPCKPEVANRHTGFLVGGTSPFGTKKPMPVCIEKSILDLPLIYINGGRRGFLVGVHPHDILRVLQPKVVEAALKD